MNFASTRKKFINKKTLPFTGRANRGDEAEVLVVSVAEPGGLHPNSTRQSFRRAKQEVGGLKEA